MKMVNRVQILRESMISRLSALDYWIKNHQETGSFATKDNRSEEENELAQLRKENQRLRWKMIFAPKGINATKHIKC